MHAHSLFSVILTVIAVCSEEGLYYEREHKAECTLQNPEAHGETDNARARTCVYLCVRACACACACARVCVCVCVCARARARGLGQDCVGVCVCVRARVGLVKADLKLTFHGHTHSHAGRYSSSNQLTQTRQCMFTVRMPVLSVMQVFCSFGVHNGECMGMQGPLLLQESAMTAGSVPKPRAVTRPLAASLRLHPLCRRLARRPHTAMPNLHCSECIAA